MPSERRGRPAVGTFAPQWVKESSGLARSRRFPGVFFTHNDSGDSARLFAVRADGRLIRPEGVAEADYQGIQVEGALARDWEEMGSDGAGNLWIGDIGNNANERRDLIFYEIPEPDPTRDTTVQVSRIVRFHYPEQTAFPPAKRNFDCEAFFYDEGALYLITKHRSDADGCLYRVAIPATSTQASEPAQLLSRRRFGDQVTAASLSDDRRFLAVLTYDALWLMERPGDPAQTFFEGRTWRLPLSARQCEAVAWESSTALLVTNEQRDIFRITLPELFRSPQP